MFILDENSPLTETCKNLQDLGDAITRYKEGVISLSEFVALVDSAGFTAETHTTFLWKGINRVPEELLFLKGVRSVYLVTYKD